MKRFIFFLAFLCSLCIVTQAQQYLSVSESVPIATNFNAVSFGSGGSCTAGTHSIAITIVTPDGETGLSNGANATCVASDSLQLNNVPLGSPYATARNIWMTKVGTTSPYFFGGTIANNTGVSGLTFVTPADTSLTIQARTSPVPVLPSKPMWQLLNGFFLPVFDNNFLSTIGSTSQRIVLGGGTLALYGGSTTKLGVSTGLSDPVGLASGTTQNQYYPLTTVLLPAASFNSSTRGFSCEAWALSAANANAKDFKVTVGATTIVTVTGSTVNAKPIHATVTCLRAALNSQNCVATLQLDTATVVNMGSASSVIVDDSGGLIATNSQNTAAAAASATGVGMYCNFIQ